VGQLGNNTLIGELTPIQVPGLDSVIEIAAGDHYCMAKRADSTIWVWGQNGIGQLGNGTATNLMIPVQMMLDCGPFECPAPQLYQGDSILICQGDSVSIGGTYQFTAGLYDDSLNTSQGCDSIIQIALTLSQPQSVSFTGLDTTYCNVNSIINMTGNPSGGSFSGQGTGGTVFNPSVAGIGTHTITYTYNDGVCTSTASQTVTVTVCTGIDERAITGLTIYPNPSTGVINIQSAGEVQIINTIGEIILRTTDNQIDLSGYGKGIYFVKAGSTVKKLILTK